MPILRSFNCEGNNHKAETSLNQQIFLQTVVRKDMKNNTKKCSNCIDDNKNNFNINKSLYDFKTKFN